VSDGASVGISVKLSDGSIVGSSVIFRTVVGENVGGKPNCSGGTKDGAKLGFLETISLDDSEGASLVKGDSVGSSVKSSRLGEVVSST
jgi:hypothetical protein